MLDQNFIQIILTILCGFALSLFLGWLIIPVLRRLKAGQEIREVGPNWHATKAGTPTMGGLTFIGASLLCLVFGIRHMKQGDFFRPVCAGLVPVLRTHRLSGRPVQGPFSPESGPDCHSEGHAAAGGFRAVSVYSVSGGALTCDLYIPL